MKTPLFAAGTLLLVPLLAAQTTTTQSELPVTVTVTVAPGAAIPPPPVAAAIEPQQLYYAPATTIVSPEKARQVVDSFHAAYEKLGKPSFLLYVNRELVDTTSGPHLTSGHEHVETNQVETKSAFEPAPGATNPAPAAAVAAPQTQVTVITGGTNTTGAAPSTQPLAPGKSSVTNTTTRTTADRSYNAPTKSAPLLADRQTVRDIERLFGRPLRAGGARLADQRLATDLMADKPIDHFTGAVGEAASKDRAALAQIADVVIEVLISTRNLTVPAVSGDQTLTVPDIQVTAIRLKDSVIIGQASASDVLGKKNQAARLARQFDVSDIAEATALALMEDIALTSGN